jgi:hypothetical protein
MERSVTAATAATATSTTSSSSRRYGDWYRRRAEKATSTAAATTSTTSSSSGCGYRDWHGRRCASDSDRSVTTTSSSNGCSGCSRWSRCRGNEIPSAEWTPSLITVDERIVTSPAYDMIAQIAPHLLIGVADQRVDAHIDNREIETRYVAIKRTDGAVEHGLNHILRSLYNVTIHLSMDQLRATLL